MAPSERGSALLLSRFAARGSAGSPRLSDASSPPSLIDTPANRWCRAATRAARDCPPSGAVNRPGCSRATAHTTSTVSMSEAPSIERRNESIKGSTSSEEEPENRGCSSWPIAHRIMDVSRVEQSWSLWEVINVATQSASSDSKKELNRATAHSPTATLSTDALSGGHEHECQVKTHAHGSDLGGLVLMTVGAYGSWPETRVGPSALARGPDIG
jgi:hypothetical protein